MQLVVMKLFSVVVPWNIVPWAYTKKKLTENDYRQLILDEYTFLKRPVMVIGGEVFVGNSRKTVDAALAASQA